MINDLMLNSKIEEFAEFIAKESFTLVNTVGKQQSQDVSMQLSTKFIQFYIELVLQKTLNAYIYRNMSEEEAYEYTKNAYLAVKEALQKEIANGFEKSFSKYVGRNVDYYCQINPIPEPINKEAC